MAPPHESRQFHLFNVLPHGGSYVGSPFGHPPTIVGDFNLLATAMAGGQEKTFAEGLVGSPNCLVRLPNGLVGSPNDLEGPQKVWCGLSPEFLFQQDTTCLHECE